MPSGALSSVFWAIIIIWSRPAHGQDCTRFNTSRIPEVEPSSYTDVDYFSCADGAFLTIVDVWHYYSVGEFRWICSDGDTSYFPEELSSYLLYSRVTFDVGITAVETSFQASYYDSSSDSHVYLGDCYIGGYNVSSSTWTSDGVIFAWSGPFGAGDNYTEESWSSNCPDDSYATGVTWWSSPSFNFVNGIQLECAEITSTCYPPGLENQDDDLTSTSTGGDDNLISADEDDYTGTGASGDVTSSANTGGDDDLTSTDIDDAIDVGSDDVLSTDAGYATDDINTTESNDTSSGTEMVTIIAAAISTAVAVVAIAVVIGLCFFFRSKRHRESTQAGDTQAHQGIGPHKAGASSAAATTSHVVVLSAPVRPSAYIEPPPAYQPRAAPTVPPPDYFSQGHVEPA